MHAYDLVSRPESGELDSAGEAGRVMAARENAPRASGGGRASLGAGAGGV